MLSGTVTMLILPQVTAPACSSVQERFGSGKGVSPLSHRRHGCWEPQAKAEHSASPTLKTPMKLTLPKHKTTKHQSKVVDHLDSLFE